MERPLVSIRFCNGDNGDDDISAKHRTHDPKKGGDHSCPPFGEPPALLIWLNCDWGHLVPTGNLLAAARRAAGLQQAELASMAGVDASVVSKTSTGGQVAFNGAGGTQVLNLLYDSTTLNDPCVHLLGEAATQWRIMGFGANGAMATSNAGISVTT